MLQLYLLQEFTCTYKLKIIDKTLKKNHFQNVWQAKSWYICKNCYMAKMASLQQITRKFQGKQSLNMIVCRKQTHSEQYKRHEGLLKTLSPANNNGLLVNGELL